MVKLKWSKEKPTKPMKKNYNNKICLECKKEYTPTNGRQKFCNSCKNNYQTKYYILNKKRKKIYKKKWYRNKYGDFRKIERICEICKKKYYPTGGKQKYCKSCKDTNWNQKVSEIRERQKIKYEKDCLMCNNKYITNIKNQKYCSNCKPIYRKIKRALQGRIIQSMQCQNASKNKKTIDYLGCSIAFLIHYLESKFQENMSWENYGVHGWHIDHIRPCSLYDLTNKKQITINKKQISMNQFEELRKLIDEQYEFYLYK